MQTQTVTGEIEVDVPVRTVYNQWTQFEDFPAFMSGVKEVRQLDDSSLSWKVQIGGVERGFTTNIVEQEPDERIVWQSVAGPRHAGMVSFEPLSDTRTRVELRLDWDPEGFVEKAGALLQLDDAQVRADLEKFADLIESNGFETGAWRGSIDGHETLPPGTAGPM